MHVHEQDEGQEPFVLFLSKSILTATNHSKIRKLCRLKGRSANRDTGSAQDTHNVPRDPGRTFKP